MPERRLPTPAELALLDPDGAFLGRLRDDGASLARLARGLWTATAAARRRRLIAIVDLAHRLGGAAGTFGYEEVGIAAQELEGIVAAFDRDAGRCAIDSCLADLQVAIGEVLRCAEDRASQI
jgi:HPt (histidine-containing phosphotransfer) domain-containing protein